MGTNFDIKKFLIKEGMTRVSRDRKRLLKEDWADDNFYSDDEVFPGFRVPKRWKDINGNFTMPAGDMSKLAGTGGHYPKELIGKDTKKAAWDGIKEWDVANFFDFHGIVDEELKSWASENISGFEEKDWHCNFSKGSDRATGRYVGFTSDDFMELDEPAEKAGWVSISQRSPEGWTMTPGQTESINDYLLVLQDTADIIVEIGGYDWALVWYLKKV